MSRKFPVSIAHQLGAINRLKALREESAHDSKINALELLVDDGDDELLPTTDPTTGSTAINEEAIHNFLGNVRLSDICLAHGDQFVPDAESDDDSTSLETEKPSEKVTEKVTEKTNKSRRPAEPKSPTHSSAPATSNKATEHKRHKPSKVNLWRAAANLETKPKLESLLDGDFLNKLEGKMEKASVSSLHDQLNQRMMKDANDFQSAVKPKHSKKEKSKKKKPENEQSPTVSSNRIRAKITSVQKFNELFIDKQSPDV